MVAVFCYLVRANGVSGPNAYGPEFGDDWDKVGGEALVDDGPLAGATNGVRFAGNMRISRNRPTTNPDAGYVSVERRRVDRGPPGGFERRRPQGGFGRR